MSVRSGWLKAVAAASALAITASVAVLSPANAHAVYVPTVRDSLEYDGVSYVSGTEAFPEAITLGPGGTIFYTHSDYNRSGELPPDSANYVVGLSSAGSEIYREGAEDYSVFQWPGGLDFLPNGNLVVADTGESNVTPMPHHRISVQDTSLQTEVATFGHWGSSSAEFMAPGGVASSSDGTIWVSDTENHRVQHFTGTGQYLGEWPVAIPDSYPDGIVVDADGNIWVALNGVNTIQKYSPYGELLQSISTWDQTDLEGNVTLEDDTFWSPRSIAIDAWGVIYVADAEAGRIVRFAEDGRWLGTFNPGGMLQKVSDIDVDLLGNVYAADYMSDAVYKFRFAMADPDTVAPVTTSNVPAGWSKTPVNVALNAVDASTSVQATYFSTDGEDPQNVYTGPFLVSTEGTTTIKYHSIDAAENVEDVKTQYLAIDSMPPTSTISVPPLTYGYETTVTMTGSDAMSGVKRIVYHVDGGFAGFYTGPFTVIGLGAHVIQYYTIDNADNIEAPRYVYFTLEAPDVEPPLTSSNISPSWISQNHSIEITATDNMSGVAASYLSTDGAFPTQPYPGPIMVTTEGTTTVKFYSVDGQNNTEQLRTEQLRIDKTKPVSTSDIQLSYVDSATINLQASDSISGVLDITWNVDGGEWNHSNTVTSNTWGNHTVTWYATDYAGNQEQAHISTFTVLQPDNQPPITGDNIPSNWVRGPFNIIFDAFDVVSQVAGTYYSSDGTTPTVLYGGPFAFNTEGENTIKFFSVDTRGNQENQITRTLRIDNTAPVSTSNAASSYMGTATVTFQATDNLAPITALWYRVDGGTWVSGRPGDSAQAAGVGPHSMDFYSVDAANNIETTRTVNFDITAPDMVPPVTTLNAPAGWVTGSASIILTAEDASSTVAATWYSLDGTDPPLTLYMGQLSISEEGITPIKYRSSDSWGNFEDVKSGQVMVDNTAPVTSSDATSTYVDLAEVNLTPNDPLSGVAYTKYRIDGGAWQTGTLISVSGYWTHNVQYYSVDNVGKIEATKSKTFTIRRADRTYQQGDANLLYKGTWASANSGATKKSSDTSAAVWFYSQSSRIRYVAYKGADLGILRISVDGGAWNDVDLYNSYTIGGQQVWDSGDIDFDYHLVQVEYTGTKNPASSGTAINLDNVIIEGNLYPVPDDTAPVTTSNINSSWQNGPVSVSLSSTDATTGVAATYYSTDGSVPSIPYAGPVSITPEGTRTFKYFSTDARGNAETVKTESVRIDNTAPITTSNAVASYVGTASVTLLPADAYSGVAYTMWRADAGAWATGTVASVPASQVGSHTIEWYSADNLAHIETTKSASFVVLGRREQTDPAIYAKGTWSTLTNGSLSGGTYGYTTAASGGAYVTFTGSRIDYITTKSNNFGKARMTLDGGAPVDVDLYSAATAYQQKVWSSGAITPGTHTLKIEYTGTKNASSTGYTIGLDALDISGEPVLDATAPVTTSDADGSWRSADQTVTLSASDGNTWVASTNYRIDGGATTPYVAPFSVSAEGTHTVEYWSLDGAGNTEATVTATVRIDKTAPVTTDDVPATWVQGPVAVHLSPSDAASGIDSLLYSTDGSDPSLVATGGVVNVSAEGVTTLKYRALDVAGNYEPIKTATVRIDDTAPVSNDDAPAGWVSGPVSLVLGSTDPLSDVSAIVYRIGEGAETTYTAPLDIAAEGTTTVTYHAIDAAGNTEDDRTAVVRIDHTAPATTDDAPVGWVDGPVSVSLTPADAVSGVAATLYSLDGSEPTLPYTGSIPVAAQGTTTLKFCSVDVKGNVEPTVTRYVMLDNDAPVTTDDAPGGWVNGPVTVTLSPTDTVSGVAGTAYILDGSDPQVYGAPLVLSAEGTHTIEYRSIDIKGNAEETRTATVRIDDTAPVSADDAPAGWVSGPVSVTLTSADPVSGVTGIVYRINQGAETTYTAPLDIAAEGTTTVTYHAIDAAGNAENVCSAVVQIDHTAPATGDDAPVGWTDGPLSVTLTPADAVSGVAATFYSLDGSEPTLPYTGPVEVAAQGTTTLKFYSVDVKGNAEPTVSRVVMLDNDAPTTTDDAPDGWVSSPVTVTLVPTDAVSGVAETTYVLDGGEPRTYGAPLVLSTEGTHLIEYFSVDLKGNVEETRTATVRIDDTAPVSSDDAPAGWVSGPVIVTLSPADPVSGVNALLYSLDGSEPSVPYTTPLVIAAQGVTTVKYAAIDIKGNIEETRIATVSIDDVAPATTDDAPVGWVSGPVTVTLSPADAASGVDSVLYSLDGSEPTLPYTEPIPVTAQGTTTLKFFSVDVKGNVEPTVTRYVMLDNDAPATTDDAPTAWVNTPVTVSLSPTDAISGVAATTYVLDGAEPQFYVAPLTMSSDGTHTVAYRSIDVKGNAEETRTATVRIDTAAPVTASNAAASYPETATITLSPADPLSGVALTEYRLDGGAWTDGTTVTTSVGGPHTLEWRSTDAIGNAEQTETAAFDVVKRFEQTDGSVYYRGSWWTVTNTSLSAGSHTRVAGSAAAYFTFKGTSVDLVALKSSNYGIAKVTVDNGDPIFVDTYAPSAQFKARVFSAAGLSDTTHTVGVEWTGTKNAASSSTDIAIDAIDVVGTLVADTLAPTTTASSNGAWRSTSETFTLSASDANTCVTQTRFRLNGGSYNTYTAAFAVTVEGTTTIDYYSVDAANNTEPASSALVRIDKTAPGATDDASTSWSSSSVTVHLSATDSGSGVSSILYSTDGSVPTIPCAGSVTVAGEGVTTVKYRAVDAVGNSSAVKAATVRIDKTAPTVSDNGTGQWSRDPVTLTLSGSDAGAGGVTYTYSTDGTDPSLATSGTISVTAPGSTVVKYQATDAVGNSSAVASATVRIDDTAPVTTSNATAGYSETATITLSPTDPLSGVASTEYRLDGSAWTDGTIATTSVGGPHTVEWRSTDAVGNIEEAQTVAFDVIKRFEQTDARVYYRGSWWAVTNASLSAGSHTRVAGSAASYFTFKGTSVDLIALKSSNYGIAKVTVDNGDPMFVDTYAPSAQFKARVFSAAGLSDTTHTVGVEWTGTKNTASSATDIAIDAVDVAGTLVADTLAPTTTTSASGAWRSTNETITLSASDANSCVTQTHYRLNGGSDTTYTAPFVVSAEGTTSVEYYSVDAASNTEATGSALVRIDKIAPGVEDDAPGSWSSSSVTVHLSATDAGSGVSSILYSTDGSVPATPCAGSVTVTDEGVTTLKYRAVDAVGNASAIKSATVRIDKAAPTVSDDGTGQWSRNPVTLTLSSSDAGAGAVTYTYSTDGTDPSVVSTGTIGVTTSGSTVVKYRATDAVGNASAVNSTTVRIDAAAPVTASNAAASYSEAATITLSPADPLSGVASTEYRLDGGAWTSGTTVATSVGGPHTLEWRSTDAAGNQELTQSAQFTLGRTFEQADAHMYYRGAWWTVSHPTLSGGSHAKIAGSGDLRFAFKGTSVDLISLKSSSYGIARVTLDGGAPQMVDLYSASSQPKSTVFSASGLTDSVHTVLIEWTGTKNAASSASDLGFDAVKLIGEMAEYPETRAEQTDTHIAYSGMWTEVPNVSLSAGSHTKTDAEGGAYISFRGPSADIIALKASSYGIAKVTVDGGPPQMVDLYAPASAVQWKAKVMSLRGLTDTTHTVTYEWTGTKNAASTGTQIGLDAVDFAFDIGQAAPPASPTTRLEQTDSRIAFEGPWYGVSHASLSGGNHARLAAAGTTAIAFTGTEVHVVALKASSYGIASISIDGGAPQMVDLYGSSTAVQWKSRVWSATGLTNGPHTVTVQWTGTKNPASTGSDIGIDAVDVLGSLDQAAISSPMTKYQQDNANLAYEGPWFTTSHSSLSGGSQLKLGSVGRMTALFSGTAFDIMATKGSSYGIATISIDGGPAQAVDMYSASTQTQATVFAMEGLSDGPHTAVVSWTGTKNSSAVGTDVTVDAIRVLGTLDAP